MLIPLDQLETHPANANVMPERLLAKLTEHIRSSGRYPPLIVRPLVPRDEAAAAASYKWPPAGPATARYQILDGHHRALALRRLQHTHAHCDVWSGVDDADAAMLLLTLNRLRGEDDPRKRGALLGDLASVRALPPERLARLLPDDAQRIERLMALARAAPARVPADADLPDPARQREPLTVFLRREQRTAVLERLRTFDADRSKALLKALGIAPPEGGPSCAQ